MDDMNEYAKKIGLLGLGLAILTKEKAEEFAEELVKTGELNEEESTKFLKDLLKKSEKERSELEKKIREEVKAASSRMNLATKDDISKLEKRLKALEKKKKK